MMEEEEGLGGKKGAGGAEGEVDYKTKAGTAWSHSYLNQKPWHPLSYPNQRRKWIAEQTHSQRQRRQEEVAREVSLFSLAPSPSPSLSFYISFFIYNLILKFPRLCPLSISDSSYDFPLPLPLPLPPTNDIGKNSLLRSRNSSARRLSSPRRRRRR